MTTWVRDLGRGLRIRVARTTVRDYEASFPQDLVDDAAVAGAGQRLAMPTLSSAERALQQRGPVINIWHEFANTGGASGRAVRLFTRLRNSLSSCRAPLHARRPGDLK
jgi:hypothetical protein